VAPCVIVPGRYDGVHLGHRARIRKACTYARARGLMTLALVMATDPFRQTRLSLTSLPRRIELLRNVATGLVAPELFTTELAEFHAEAFVDHLVDLQARVLVIAPEFSVGAVRDLQAGDILRRIRERGIDVLNEAPVWLNGEAVSSSAVRRALKCGDVARAASLLGRLHEAEGAVVQGDRRGRALGFPTANLDPQPVLQPLDGVYAVFVRELGSSGWGPPMPGIASLGPRPTFSAGRAFEVHLFDFNRDIYGRQLRVGFVHRLRGQQRFACVSELRAHIARDCENARNVLAAASAELTRCL